MSDNSSNLKNSLKKSFDTWMSGEKDPYLGRVEIGHNRVERSSDRYKKSVEKLRKASREREAMVQAYEKQHAEKTEEWRIDHAKTQGAGGTDTPVDAVAASDSASGKRKKRGSGKFDNDAFASVDFNYYRTSHHAERRASMRRAWNASTEDTGFSVNNYEMRPVRKLYVALSVAICLVITLILVYGISYLPPVGNMDNPVNNEVAARYIEKGEEEAGAANIITDMILTYRGFDTFGETTVLFTATCVVTSLLLVTNKEKRKKKWLDHSGLEAVGDSILKVIARFLMPVILLFGIYIIANGSESPGGGFAGGSVIGAGLILYSAAFGTANTKKFLNEKTYTILRVGCYLFYSVVALYFIYTGAHGMESILPLGMPGELMEIAVGAAVALTMYAFYALFRKGEI